MTTTNAVLSEDSRNSLKYVAHLLVLGLWLIAGGIFSLQQMFAAHGLGATLNFWLWFVGYVAVSSLPLKLFRSPMAVMALHAGLAIGLNLLPTSMPFGLLRAGYDLLLNHA
ncbi:MAG: hypothetical protein ACO1OB_00295 [Archangium sp.]